MPDETTTDPGSQEQEAPAPSVAHDDIMQRLLEYQRQLREGTAHDAAEEPEVVSVQTVTDTVEVVDITEAEAEMEAGADADGATAAAAQETIEVVEIAVIPEAEPEAKTAEESSEALFSAAEPETPKTGSPAPAAEDLSGRVAELEDALARVAALVAELRASFQDMAIAADERLAAIEEALARSGAPNRN